MRTAESSRVPLSCAQLWPISLAAYHYLGEAGLVPKNTELLYGCLATRLRGILVAALPPGLFVSAEQPITCPDSEPEPDLAVVSGKLDDFPHDHPHTAELVIEVCVTSHDYDRSKLRAYAAAGVKECWLVLGPEKQVEVHRQPAGGQFSERMVSGPGGRLGSVAVPSFAVDLDALFAK